MNSPNRQESRTGARKPRDFPKQHPCGGNTNARVDLREQWATSRGDTHLEGQQQQQRRRGYQRVRHPLYFLGRKQAGWLRCQMPLPISVAVKEGRSDIFRLSETPSK
jgi:hypothetical protein